MTDTAQATLPGTEGGEARFRKWSESRLKEVLFDELPPIAQERGWPVVYDHCLARVAYDCACGGVWYDEVGAKPFYSEATERQLQNALGIALRMEPDGMPYVARRNEQSLYYRGEIELDDAQYWHGPKEN